MRAAGPAAKRVLASELVVPVHALDSHEPFLADLQRRAGRQEWMPL
jgi:hypothetical protein